MRYMTVTSSGWQEFTPAEANRQGYGDAHIARPMASLIGSKGVWKVSRLGQESRAAMKAMAVYESARYLSG
ncbi:MAG: hypothetical protein R2867_34170 [Caldilineaceae bacterium]